MAKLLTDWKQSSLIPSPCSESLHSEGEEDRVNDQGPVLCGETSRIFPRLISFRELAEAAANQEASWAYSLVAKRKIKCGGKTLCRAQLWSQPYSAFSITLVKRQHSLAGKKPASYISLTAKNFLVICSSSTACSCCGQLPGDAWR